MAATSSSSRPAKKSSPTSPGRSCAATANCPKLLSHQTSSRRAQAALWCDAGAQFTMKDAYSFDRDAGAGRSYDAMFQAYCRIFDRVNLQYRAVAADTGAIGGDRSQEFQVIADTGEDAIVYCPTSDYAANIELAEALAPARYAPALPPRKPWPKVPTPGKAPRRSVGALLGCR